MKRKSVVGVALLLSIFSFVISSCSDDDHTEKDMEKPQIESSAEASPQNCQVYHQGDIIPFSYKFTDNQELGSYNIEIHNNFDHHTHSTEGGECEQDPEKEPVKPWVYNQDFPIPDGKLTYDAQIEIPIPADIDPGDYHFMIRVTDKAGWQEIKALAIKIAPSI